jgi:hypothetical protein
MSKAKKLLTPDLKADINRVGVASIETWFRENEIKIPSTSDNLYDGVEEALEDGALTMEQLQHAIAELEESGSKKILLYKAKNFRSLDSNRAKVLQVLRKKGIAPAPNNWGIGKAGEAPGTLIYMFWDKGLLKIKWGEKQYDTSFDSETEKVIKEEKQIRVVLTIDTKTGFTQLRFDTPGNKNRHKNDEGKTSETVYENYYVDLMKQLFPDLEFVDFDLNGVANQIEMKEKDSFRLTKGVASIVQNAKQTFASSGRKTDVRDLPNYKGALAQGGAWRSEDLTGYWIASASNGELKKDLFMRISRKFAHIRVQRGCLEKELGYGIAKIRQIQDGI